MLRRIAVSLLCCLLLLATPLATGLSHCTPCYGPSAWESSPVPQNGFEGVFDGMVAPSSFLEIDPLQPGTGPSYSASFMGMRVVLGTGGVSYHLGGDCHIASNVDLQLGFREARPVEPVGYGRFPHLTNVLIGDDPDRWIRNAPSFSEVLYEGLWDGIDLRYRIVEHGLKYDLIVHPGADPSSIGFLVADPGTIDLVSDDTLAIRTPAGDVIDEGLVAHYLGLPGANVPCRFVIRDDRTVGFDLGPCDRSRIVVIDPLVYSTYLGGSEEEEVKDMFVDPLGYVYVTGKTRSDDFPLTGGAFCTTKRERSERAFVSKLSPDGTRLEYSTYIGGDKWAWANGIVVDEEGRAIITGRAHVTDFPTTEDAFQVESNDTNANGDAFVCKLSTDGSSLVFSTFVGGEGYDNGNGIALGPQGDVYVTGGSESDDFPTTPNAFQRSISKQDDYDLFFCILTSNGAALKYSTLLGGGDRDFGNDIAVDGSGNAYIAGGGYSSDLPVTEDAYQGVFGGGRNDACACKFDAAGNLVYSTFIGGDGSDWGYGVVVDDEGCAYLVGTTGSTDLTFTLGDPSPNWTGEPDSFLIKLEANGSIANFSRPLPNVRCYDVSFDPAGDLLLSGVTWAEDLPVTEGAIKDRRDKYTDDGFVLKLSSDGEEILLLTYIGGTGDDVCWAVDMLASGIYYVAGDTRTDDFPVTPGAVQIAQADPVSSEWSGFVTAFTPGESSIVADAGPDRFVDQGEEVTIVGEASKDGDDILNFTWSYQYDKETVTMHGQAFTTAFDQAGEVELLLSVTDGLGNLSMDSCVVTVRDTEPPVARWNGNLTVDIGETYALDGRLSSDNCQVTKFLWTIKHQGENHTHYGEWLNFTFDQPGVNNVSLTVWDAAGNTDNVEGTVNVRWDFDAPNLAPSVDAVRNCTLGDVYSVVVSVEDNDAIAEVWVVVAFPDGWSLNTSLTRGDGDAWVGSFPVNQTGEITYTIHARDPSGNLAASDSFRVSVAMARIKEERSEPLPPAVLAIPIVVLAMVGVVVLVRQLGGRREQ